MELRDGKATALFDLLFCNALPALAVSSNTHTQDKQQIYTRLDAPAQN